MNRIYAEIFFGLNKIFFKRIKRDIVKKSKDCCFLSIFENEEDDLNRRGSNSLCSR